MKSFQTFKPFLKYCIVGTSGTLVDVLSLYIFVEFFEIPLFLATSLSFLLAVINNFILNKLWTFQNKSSNYRKLFIKFLLVACVGLILTNLSMFALVTLAGIWYIFAKLLTSLLVLSWNFLANKHWTFSLKKKQVKIPDHFDYALSIVIPAYNEERRIKESLLQIIEFVEEKGLNAEVIVVNDGSKDETSKVVEKMHAQFSALTLIDRFKNEGKGAAVKAGVEASKGQSILITDADNSTPIREWENLAKGLKQGANICIGSRYLNASNIQIKQPFFRVAISRLGNLIIRIFVVSDIKDTQCGFKLFKHEVAKEIFSRQRIKRWGFDMEVLAIAQLLDYKVQEMPVSWFNSSDSRIRPIRDTVKTLIELIRIKFYLLSGVYKD